MTLELAGVFGAGLLTFLTPCVLPLIPIYLALLLGNSATLLAGEKPTLGQRLSLFVSTLAFSTGLLIVFVALGMTATSFGTLLTEHREQLVLIGGLLIFVFGLKFLGVLNISWLEREKRIDDSKLKSRFRLVNSLVMGLVFGLGWTPCIGPILGSVLTYTASKSTSLGQGALYLAAYGLGFVLPLLVLSLFADAARGVVQRISPWLPKLEKASGAILALVGVYLMLGVTSPPASHMDAPASTTGTTSLAKVIAVAPGVKASKRPKIVSLGQPTLRPRMVQFSSSHCSICRSMIPAVGVVERDCDGRKVDVVKIDVNDRRDLATTYRVRGVPTFVFLDKSGTEVARLIGYQTMASLRQSLAAVTGETCAGLGTFDPGTESPKSTPQTGGTCKGGEKPLPGLGSGSASGTRCDS
ncbi:MAG: sulfite exporter TauE/SafE family protein [Deltaproteobacteria bacterium]|nr:sulfite exporter TauE/SafE family protein [Deltaproteobacteria bacterium]